MLVVSKEAQYIGKRDLICREKRPTITKTFTCTPHIRVRVRVRVRMRARVRVRVHVHVRVRVCMWACLRAL